MSKGATTPTHAVIDGSNLATEGRKEPSLAQLKEAVAAIEDEYDFAHVTVIVDASFEHRVAKSETKAARKAVDANEILTPPAGVIGRGDTFILEVADRAGAAVFSNDSFQEFHGTFGWLFDEGRLIGGKPVPGVGWVDGPRSPVRGPVSRRATSEKRREAPPAKAAAKKASAPQAKKASKRTRRGASKEASPAPTGDGANDPAAWKAFRADYPVGSTIAATVDRFSSHGAYGSVDGVVVYLPNRLLGDPPPTKARDVVDIGATMDFVVHRFDEERLGIDAGLTPSPDAPKSGRKPAKKTTSRRAPAKKTTKKSTAKKATTKRAAKKAAAAKPPARKKAAAKKAATRAPAKKAAKKSTANTTAAKKTAAKKKAPAKKAAKRR